MMYTLLVARLHGGSEEREILELFYRWLTPAEQERSDRFRRSDDRYRSLAAQLLVRWFYRNEAIDWQNDRMTGAHGKPFLNTRPDLCFNTAHSGHWVVAAFNSSPVGVDVEEVRPVNPELAARYFTPDELKLFAKSKDSEPDVAFLRIWTLKEAYLKFTGSGLTRSLRSFSVVPEKDYYVIEGNGKDFDPAPAVELIEMNDSERVFIAGCTVKKDLPAQVSKMKIDESLLQEIKSGK
ncbi:MAG: hypothetical protein Kow00127_03550 [Bacteroidales bacterium]